MAILCLATDIEDLKKRLASIVVGYTYGSSRKSRPVTAGELNAQGAMAALLRDALKPNLVQTLEHTPALIHGGPFGNIAHGCNSIIATKMALKLADYTITEAGFGADLGAEKFLDIKCRFAGVRPAAVVIVATVRALKHHGGARALANSAEDPLVGEDLAALERGLPNLLQHIRNITEVYGLPAVVAINAFPQDTPAELALVEKKCRELGVSVALSEVWEKGGAGGEALAREVARLCDQPSEFRFAYSLDIPIKEKIGAIAAKIYHAGRVNFLPGALALMEQFERQGYGKMPICVAKTQYSFSDDPALLGAPEGHTLTVRNLRVSAGAGFIVALTGEIMTMPGLPASPAAERIDGDSAGRITGLF
jgi:formate--tetrahydrofolate ligase